MRGGKRVLGAGMAALTVLAASGAAMGADAPRQMAQAGDLRNFSIPAQGLPAALDRFADQAGVAFAYRTGDLSTLNSPGVSGTLSPRDALQRLLAGTGIIFDFTGPATVTLTRAPVTGAPAGSTVLSPVTVEATPANPNGIIDNLPPPYAGGQVATGGQFGILGNRDIMDTPFAMTAYTSDLMQNQQAATLADVIANDPSVRVNIRGRGTNNGGGDNFTIRGFPFQNQDVSFNGLYGVLPFGTVPVETVERVEVLKGPNALLSGMAPSGGVGGAINVVPKRAGDTPLNRLTATYGSDSQFGGHFDVGRRFGRDNAIGVRVNGIYRNGNTAVAGQSSQLGVATLGLDYRGERVRLSADLGYQNDKTEAASGFGGGMRVGAGVTYIPRAPDVNARTAQAWESTRYKDTYGVLRGEFDILSNLTAYGAFGARRNTQDNLRTNFQLMSNAGAVATIPTWYPQYADSMAGQAGVRGTVDTGPIRHAFDVGFQSVHTEQGYAFGQWAPVLTSIYNVAQYGRPNTGALASPTKSGESRLTSFAAADTMSVWDDRVALTVGLRHQKVEQDNFDNVSGAKLSSYNKSAVTPAVGLVVKPWTYVSLYGNYIEGLTQGATAPANVQNAGQIFPPTKTKQKEAGVKLDLGKQSATLSVFEITQPNTILTPGTVAGSQIFTVDGEQRNRGVELATFGEAFPGLRLLGGVTYLQPSQVKTQGGANNGRDAVGVPRWMANVGVEWDPSFVRGLTLTGRMVATAAQYANATNTLDIPGWTRWDLGARYATEAFGNPLTLRANVINLFDTNYWESVAAPQGLRLAQPRTFLVSATMDF